MQNGETQIQQEKGMVTWRSPSNIAIVKYWGKHGLQLPRNPSFSFTLDAAFTETSMDYRIGKGKDARKIEVILDGEPKTSFVPKIEQFFDRAKDKFPILENIHVQIETHNSFPHSSGIASSASSMSALAMCICEIANGTNQVDLVRASELARLGSGSACRSVFPIGAVWGKTTSLAESSDKFAIAMQKRIHPVFHTFRDSILIAKSGEKEVSSTIGHNLMNSHPYAEDRYRRATENLEQLLSALESGNLVKFGEICEAEALELHALMMCSTPPYILMEPESLEMISRIKRFRKKRDIPLYFTLDAGPNVHLLYPAEFTKQVQSFIESDLAPICENGYWIDDQVGMGPAQMNQRTKAGS